MDREDAYLLITLVIGAVPQAEARIVAGCAAVAIAAKIVRSRRRVRTKPKLTLTAAGGRAIGQGGTVALTFGP